MKKRKSRQKKFFSFPCDYGRLNTTLLKLAKAEAANLKVRVFCGEASWKRFTEDELDKQILSMKKDLARKVFREMQVPRARGESPHPVSFSIFEIDELIDMIDNMVETNESSWKELGFRRRQLLLSVQRAAVLWGQFFFVRIDEQIHMSVLDYWEGYFENLVESGLATWNDLCFSRSNLKERLRKQRIVIGNNLFSFMKLPYADLESLRKWKSDIQEVVRKGKLTWKDLGFSKKDLSALEHKKIVELARGYLGGLNESSMCLLTVEENALFILDAISDDGCTWDELCVTEEEFFTKLHTARIAASQYFFVMDDIYPDKQHAEFAKLIRKLVSQKFLNWEDLEFNSSELKELKSLSDNRQGKELEDELEDDELSFGMLS